MSPKAKKGGMAAECKEASKNVSFTVVLLAMWHPAFRSSLRNKHDCS